MMNQYFKEDLYSEERREHARSNKLPNITRFGNTRMICKIYWENGISREFFIPATRGLLLSMLTSPLRVTERLCYDKKIWQETVKQPIYVIGVPRSGTTLLHDIMSRNASLGYLTALEIANPESFILSKAILSKIIKRSLPTARPMDNVKLLLDSPQEEGFAMMNMTPAFRHCLMFPKNFRQYVQKYTKRDFTKKEEQAWKRNYEYLLKKLTFTKNRKQLVLKDPGNIIQIKQLLTLFPDAKFIHIHRDPYKIYPSLCYTFFSLISSLKFHSVREEDLILDIEDSVIFIYREMMAAYERDKAFIPKENLIEIAYEDLVRTPLETIEHVHQTLEIQGFKESYQTLHDYCEKIKNYQNNEFKIDDYIKEKVNANWRHGFDLLGYKMAP